MNRTTSRCPLARLHHILPRITLWGLVALVAMLGIGPSIGHLVIQAV